MSNRSVKWYELHECPREQIRMSTRADKNVHESRYECPREQLKQDRQALLLRRVQCVVYWAEFFPGFGHRVYGSNVGTILHKHDGKSMFEMPVDMTMQEPWTRVVGGETDGNIIPSEACIDHITTRRINVIVSVATRAPNNIKVVPMQMEWMWSARSAPRYRDLDDRIQR